MNIRQEILNLNLPKDSFIVVGSGILGALGIRESNDIDMIVTQSVFDLLDRSGWKHGNWVDQVVLQKGLFDIGTLWMGKTLDGLIKDATIIGGIPYLSLDDLLTWKREKLRPKDIRDVELILAFKEIA
ncbi:MAG: hypothetical protein ABI602_02945 [Candidatus Saccharibacteria bacterium]